MLGAINPLPEILACSFKFWITFSPGRFFAVTTIKTAFVHIILNYDVQFENGSLNRPTSASFEITNTPNKEAKLMFRKRNATALRDPSSV